MKLLLDTKTLSISMVKQLTLTLNTLKHHLEVLASQYKDITDPDAYMEDPILTAARDFILVSTGQAPYRVYANATSFWYIPVKGQAYKELPVEDAILAVLHLLNTSFPDVPIIPPDVYLDAIWDVEHPVNDAFV